MPQLAIVADDLTGAADTSACFANAGLATVIRLSGATVPNADVLASRPKAGTWTRPRPRTVARRSSDRRRSRRCGAAVGLQED